MISKILKRSCIDKAYRTKKYWYIITRIDDAQPKMICAENIVIDPNIVTIEWVGTPYSDIRILTNEGHL